MLQEQPDLMFQQAANQPSNSIVSTQAEKRWTRGKESRPWLQWLNKPKSRDACVMTLMGHSNVETCCAYSPDGRRVVSGSFGSLVIWESETGLELATLTGHSGWVNSCAFCPDGKRIISAGDSVKLWDADTGMELMTLPEEACVAACYSPDGMRIVAGCEDGTLKEWDAETGAELSTLRGHTKVVMACAYSPDGRQIVSGAADMKLKIWDVEAGKELTTLQGHRWMVKSCAYSPDGKYILSGSDRHPARHPDDCTLKIWDAATGEELIHFIQVENVPACAYSPNGTTIASVESSGVRGETDKVLKIWDAKTGTQIGAVTGAGETCAFSPDGQHILSGSKIWLAAEVVAGEYTPSMLIDDCKYSPNGSRIATVGPDSLRIWNSDGTEIVALKVLNAKVKAFAFSPDGSRIVTGLSNDRLKIWDAETGRELSTLSGHGHMVTACGYSPDGRRILSGSSSGGLRIWDADTGSELMNLEGHRSRFGVCGITVCEYLPDGKRVVSASWDNKLKIWNAETGALLATLAGHYAGIKDCIQSADGKRIVSASQDKTLKIWDTETGVELAQLVGHSDSVDACVFSPDGKQIASASFDGTLRIWDADIAESHGWLLRRVRRLVTKIGLRERCQFVLKHRSCVLDCCYTPDGKFIISASADDLNVWSAKTGKKIATLRTFVYKVGAGRVPNNMCASAGHGGLYILRLNLPSDVHLPTR